MSENQVFIKERASIEAKIVKLQAALDLYKECTPHSVEFFCYLNEKLSDASSYIDRIEGIDFSL